MIFRFQTVPASIHLLYSFHGFFSRSGKWSVNNPRLLMIHLVSFRDKRPSFLLVTIDHSNDVW